MSNSTKKSAWTRWKELAAKAATWQARVLLGAFYWVVITPFAWVLRGCTDVLALKEESDGGHWVPCHDSDPREQF